MALTFSPCVAAAQVTSSLQSISLSATKPESITLGAPTPATQSLILVDGALNTYASPISITVAWDVKNSNSTVVSLVAYFHSPAQALANGTDYLSAGVIEVSTNAGASWRSITSNAVSGVGAVGGSVVLYVSPVTHGSDAKGSRAVTFSVRINLVGAPAARAGTYSGTLNLMAVSR